MSSAGNGPAGGQPGRRFAAHKGIELTGNFSAAESYCGKPVFVMRASQSGCVAKEAKIRRSFGSKQSRKIARPRLERFG